MQDLLLDIDKHCSVVCSAYGSKSYYDLLRNHRQDEKDESNGQHLQRLRSGCQAHQVRGSATREKRKARMFMIAPTMPVRKIPIH